MEDKNEKDELIFLADWIKKILKLLIKFIVNIIEFSIKKYIYILVFITVGISISYVTYKIFTPRYKGYIIIRQNTNKFSIDYCRNILDGLNRSIGFNNNSEIKKRLKIDESMAGSILNISFIQTKTNYSDSSSQDFPILLSITLNKNENLKILADALIAYLNNIQLYKNGISEELRLCKSTMELYDQKIKELEVLRANFDTNKIYTDRNSSVFFREPIDHISTYEKLISLNIQKQLYLEKLKIKNQFTLVDNNISSLDSKYRLEKFIISGTIISYFIGLILIYFTEYLYLIRAKKLMK